jgi:peptidoglycan/xylan/chitin deacetylase (PgdA/CDA1 family)
MQPSNSAPSHRKPAILRALAWALAVSLLLLFLTGGLAFLAGGCQLQPSASPSEAPAGTEPDKRPSEAAVTEPVVVDTTAVPDEPENPQDPAESGDLALLNEPPSAEQPVIALTFDDGPSVRDTGTLLDYLAAADVPATFFVLGNQLAESQPRRDLLSRAYEEGHEIANHTFSHLYLKGASPSAIESELARTSDLIESIIGIRPDLMRPPQNGYDETVQAICAEQGLSIISWAWQSCPEDWNHKGEPEYIANFVIENAANGHIILLHDTNPSTVEAIPAMIEGLKARGFRFMTVSDLMAFDERVLADDGFTPGTVYHQLKTAPAA